jgi:hypothetical protein
MLIGIPWLLSGGGLIRGNCKYRNSIDRAVGRIKIRAYRRCDLSCWHSLLFGCTDRDF